MTRPDSPTILPLLRRGAFWLCLAAAAFAVVLLMVGKSIRTPASLDETRMLTSVPLTTAGMTSGSNRPLFELKSMAPGKRYERCIVITAGSSGSVVRFAVGNVVGDLAPWLRVEGTTGTGTSRDCGDFVADGTAFYTGSLAALNSGGTDGVPTGWMPASAERRTFRIAVEVADDSRAAGAQTLATLVWGMRAKATPTTVPSDAPADPRETPSSHSAPPPAPNAALMPCPPSTFDQLTSMLAGIAPLSLLALLLLLLVLLFLAIQDRLDREDPKLAQAPLYGDPDQEFPDDGSAPWRRP